VIKIYLIIKNLILKKGDRLIYETFQEFIETNKLADYIVSDINIEDSKVIFILESPHKKEVKKKYPVAGDTGRNMSDVLFQKKEALGILITEELKKKKNKLKYDEEILKFGIVNISSLPLKKEAYTLDNLSFMEDLFFLRENITKDKNRIDFNFRKNKDEKNNLIEILVDVLKSKLQLNNKKIILCGGFAQAFYEKAFGKDKYNKTLLVSHPINWRLANKELKKKIDDYIN